VPELDLLGDPGESITDICQCPELVSRCHCTLIARNDTTMAMVVAANATATRANDVVECNDGVDEREHEQEGCCNESYELGSRWPGQSFLLLLLLGPGYYTIQCVRQ
jgi:hypothetical protein